MLELMYVIVAYYRVRQHQHGGAVSGIEGAAARPKVRVIVDTLHQLQMREASSGNFTGIRSAEHSLVYDLVPLPGGDR